ncbi:asparagine synthase (glutamine-hydrolyzing) [Longispora albida]|uniref:asparagine synthase (glutamine-hydrolyzing) n=1 Tax=Longispora albida TaxID=203523 RepID=UPI00036700BD|nr:asparagine synthase (glutamine-hydrolyzing) [Longispora albida]
MCGIAGWADPARELEDSAGVVRAMTDVLAARGPDGAGLWTDGHCALGHRRLAILDPAGGHQPMIAEDDAGEPLLVLSYNGEVFNHAELRAELELAGHKFRTRTDTEVVLRAWQEWGEDAPARLAGMFAFAVWEPARRRLVLVRDRLGVKPLAYAQAGSGLLFASEARALFTTGLVRRAVSADGLRDHLASVRTPGRTWYDGVAEVRPGHLLVLDDHGVHERPYWRLEARPHEDTVPESAARVRALLTRITRESLDADVPLGALLSGGLDSSALVALAQRENQRPLATFSVGFAGPFTPDALRATPDAPYVRAMVAHCGTRHRDLVLDPAALADPGHRLAALAARDHPGSGEMDISLYLLFRAVREHVTVALSGESADEVFGGYPWFHDPVRTGPGGYPWRYLTGHSGAYKALLRTDVAAELDLETHRAAHYDQALTETPRLRGETGTHRRTRELFHLHLTRWLPDLLDRKDRLSMASGLEVRVPFCDHRLVEYAFNAPWSQHTHDGREKSLLRAATASLLPAAVRERVKAPYPSTGDPRYHAVVREQAGDLLLSPASPAWAYLDPAALRQRLTRPAGDWATRAALDFAINLDLWLTSHTRRA